MGATGVTKGRVAYADGDWRTARELLRRARAEDGLEAGDLELLARTAWWLGDAVSYLEEADGAHRARLEEGDAAGGAAIALELSLSWATEGDLVIAEAWLNRARRLLRDLEPSPVHGYLLYLDAVLTLEVHQEPEPAHRAATELRSTARRFGDEALDALALALSGMASVWAGDTVQGFRDLDEAMLPVLAGVVPPQWSGEIYCSVIHLCHQLGDLARMRAWTDALERWATPLSETFMYAGITRVHQLQLLSAEGDWTTVEHELADHSGAIAGFHSWVAAEGYRELGDVCRLRGDVRGARAAYRRTRELGVAPQPGEALLEEAAGRPGEALVALRAALAEEGRVGRARLLLPTVDVALRAGDALLAEACCAELDETATLHGTPGLRAWSDQAAGSLLLHRGAWDAALGHLESAAAVYRAQRHRHATARVHELLGRARAGRGEAAAAAAEAATALAIYRQLGAAADVARLEPHRRPGGMTPREEEVLRCVLAGCSNREVASHLVISEKTVSRHLANVYLKAGVSSRTAAAAWARDQGLEPMRVVSSGAPNTP